MITGEENNDTHALSARKEARSKSFLRNFAAPFFLQKIVNLFNKSGYEAGKYVAAKFDFAQWVTEYHFKKNYPLTEGQVGLITNWGIGDTLMVAGLASQLITSGKVKSIALLVKPGHDFIAGLFPGIDKIYVVPNFADHIERTSNYPRLTPQIIAPNQYYYAHFFNWEMGGLIGHKKVHLLDAYRAVLKLDQSVQLAIARQLTERETALAQAIFAQHRLEPAKTVIVAPSAVTISSFPPVFWDALYNKLLAEGYKIVLNAPQGDQTNSDGIVPINLSFAQLVAIAQQCAGIIAVRSGLCDLLSIFKTNLFVLYPDREWLGGKLFDGSSINAMWSTYNTTEVVIEKADATIAVNIVEQFIANVN